MNKEIYAESNIFTSELANSFYSGGEINSDGSHTFYLGKVFFHSLKDACEKLDLSYTDTSALVNMLGLEAGLNRSIVKYKYGCELEWFQDGLPYFRYEIGDSVKYLNSIELVDMYLKRLGGILSLEELCNFYSLKKGIISYLDSKGFASREQKVDAIAKLGSLITPTELGTAN